MKNKPTHPPHQLTENEKLKLAVLRYRKIMGDPKTESGPEFLTQRDLFKLGFTYILRSSINDTPVMTVTLRNGVMINLQGLCPSRPSEFWQAVVDAFEESYAQSQPTDL